MKRNHETPKKETIVTALKLPKDVCCGAMRVSLTGGYEAWIDNYKGILEYTDCHILLQGKDGRVCLEGNRLCIDYYTNEDMKISGSITSVRFL